MAWLNAYISPIVANVDDVNNIIESINDPYDQDVIKKQIGNKIQKTLENLKDYFIGDDDDSDAKQLPDFYVINEKQRNLKLDT